MAIVLTSMVNLKAQACCAILPPAANDVFFTNATVANPQVLTNQNVYISGTVNFNAAVTMTRCTVFMCQNAILNVNNAPLTVQEDIAGNRSIITGCTTMWDEININQGASIRLNNCVVRDGIDGIRINNGFNNQNSRIENTVFSANQVAIQSQNTTNLTFQAFTDNRFARFRVPVSGLGSTFPFNLNPLPPFNNQAPVIGISFFGVTGSVGTAGAQNLFTNLSVGIEMVNSTMSVQNCQFRNNLVTGWNGSPSGIGILATSSTLIIEHNYSNGRSCEFISNNRGVKSDATFLLRVHDAMFMNQNLEDLEAGGSINANNVNIEDNDFFVQNLVENCISVERGLWFLGNSINIRNNHIIMDGNSTPWSNINMIDLTTRPGGPTDNVYVADNVLDCNHGAIGGGIMVNSINGIFATGNAFGYQFSGNQVNYNNNANQGPNRPMNTVGIGISMGNAVPGMAVNVIGPNNVVRSNNLGCGANVAIGPTQCSHIKCGIHVANAPNTYVCSNDVDNPFQNYHFSGDLTGSEFGRNLIGDGAVGVNFCDGGVITGGCSAAVVFPDQDYRMNVWQNNNNYSATSASYPLAVLPGVPQMPINWGPNNNWLVDPNLPGHDPEAIAPASTPGAWFFQVPNGGLSMTTICDGILPPPPGALPEPPAGERAKNLVEGKYYFPEPSQQWDFERFLLGEMLRYPNSYSSEPVAVGYFSSKQNTALGQIALVEKLISEAASVGISLQSDIQTWQASLQQLAAELGELEVTEGQSENLSPEGFQAAKTGILNQMADLFSQIDQANSTLKTQRAAYWANTVVPVLNTIAPTNGIEANYKTIYQLCMKANLGQTVTATDSSEIRAIAHGCPDYDGAVVTIARDMLPMEESRAFAREGEDEYCLNPSERRGKTEVENIGFQIAPNPANESLSILFGQPFTGKLTITDISGRFVVESFERETLQKHLDVSGLTSGVYFITLKPETGPSVGVRFSVVH